MFNISFGADSWETTSKILATLNGYTVRINGEDAMFACTVPSDEHMGEHDADLLEFWPCKNGCDPNAEESYRLYADEITEFHVY